MGRKKRLKSSGRKKIPVMVYVTIKGVVYAKIGGFSNRKTAQSRLRREKEWAGNWGGTAYMEAEGGQFYVFVEQDMAKEDMPKGRFSARSPYRRISE